MKVFSKITKPFNKVIQLIDSKLSFSNLTYLIIASVLVLGGSSLIIEYTVYDSFLYWFCWSLMSIIASLFILLSRFGTSYYSKKGDDWI